MYQQAWQPPCPYSPSQHTPPNSHLSATTTPRRGARPRASSTVTTRWRRLWSWAWRASTSAATLEDCTPQPAPARPLWWMEEETGKEEGS